MKLKLNLTLTRDQVATLETMLAKDNDDLKIKDLNKSFKAAVIKAKASVELKKLNAGLEK